MTRSNVIELRTESRRKRIVLERISIPDPRRQREARWANAVLAVLAFIAIAVGAFRCTGPDLAPIDIAATQGGAP